MNMVAAVPQIAGEDVPTTPASPTVFVRTISAPPGLPWDQARMAELDARAGAPLPLSEVVYRLRRLEPWRPGRAVRYAACYVRAREVGDRLVASALVDGRSVTIEFVSSVERARRLRLLATLAAIAAVTGLLGFGAVFSALAVRSAGAARIAAAEQSIAVRSRQARIIEGLKAQTLALDATHPRGLSVADFLNDLAWAARAKAPGAHMDALHWDHGYMGVETRGDTPPFGQVNRPVVKDDRPVRPGVWLWGVGPAGPRPVQHGPVKAAP